MSINFKDISASQKLLFAGFTLQALAILLQSFGNIVAATEDSELPIQPVKASEQMGNVATRAQATTISEDYFNKGRF